MRFGKDERIYVTEAYITRTAVALPNQPVDNDRIEAILGMVGGKLSRIKRVVLKQNGIRQRYYVLDPVTREPRYSNAQLTAMAVRKLWADHPDFGGVGCLACGTTMPDQLAPNHAAMVHGELKNPPCEIIATAGICMSGMTALKYAWMSIRCGEHRKPRGVR